MVLYMIYKNYKTVIDDEKLSENKADIVNLSMSETKVCSQPNSDEKGSDTQNEHEQKRSRCENHGSLQPRPVIFSLKFNYSTCTKPISMLCLICLYLSLSGIVKKNV